MSAYTCAELAQCAEREVKLRIRVYPTRVANRRMTLAQAQRETAMMREIMLRLQADAAKELLL
jgi:hypothetical protein